jgi:hypothetical protein
VTGGVVTPSQVESAPLFGVTADYGEIGPAWRVEFSTTFWSSRYHQSVVRRFADSLARNIDDPTGDATVRASTISVYDVTLGMGFRRYLRPRSAYTETFTLGVAAHVLNAEGELIRGTLVERALDQIAAGLFAEVGAQARLFRRVQIEAAGRVDLLSAYRSFQLRGGIGYYFGEPGRARRTPSDDNP